ncbi:hypothetical protein CTEN210_04107 [Chaetoceros tenuissimus]|uniref:Ankyrin repeat protein n=1 Tax=Chaetoceros tenuissimus TaxID=426638 RepID=A0AAD3CKB6_9STRA|nr:hypothetical protein CTEN210_04107 [Chaetoceros tenuissimus]
MNPVVARAIDGEICHQAIFHKANDGIVEKLKLLLNYGYEWDDQTFTQAAKRGRLRVMQWLRYMGCPIYADTCVAAVEYGSMEMLKYAYEVVGCALSKEAYAYCFSDKGLQHRRDIPTTVRDSHRELLKYLEKNDCPKPDKSDWRIFY